MRIASRKLTGDPLELAYDDDASEGGKSIAGGGHAVKFDAPAGGEWYLRAVSLYGSRYGTTRPPRISFEVALCDKDMNIIAGWKKPYATFRKGPAKWVRMEVVPTRVPATFYVCLNFRPTNTRGVSVAYDTSTKGHSLTAVPGKRGRPFREGDWMIRAEIDQPKHANALEGEPQPETPAKAGATRRK